MPATVEIDRPELGVPHHHHTVEKSGSIGAGLHPNHLAHAGKHSHHLSRGLSLPTDVPNLSRVNTAPPMVESPDGIVPQPHRSRPTSWSGSTAFSFEHLKPIHTHGLHLRHRSSLPSPPLTHGPRNPPQPLLPARNPAPFDIIGDVVPFFEPIRHLWRWIKRKTESEQSKQRRLRKHRK
jgi:hypothetical protein